jgi:hypothetical protein
MFYFLRLVWVAGCLWALHKVVPFLVMPELFRGKQFKSEDNSVYLPYFFYQIALQICLFWILRLVHIAGWLRLFCKLAR